MSVFRPTEGDYIQHHLDYFQLNLHTFKLGDGGFWTLNLDTIIVSTLLGGLFLFIFIKVARRATSGVPGKLQNVIELGVETVQSMIMEIYHGRSILVAPLALSIFVWVFLMNFMDLLPVDLIPKLASWIGIADFRDVPTDDLNLTFALAGGVFLLTIFYNIKIKGFLLFKEIFCAPFGVWLLPINVIFRVLEEIVKPVSLSLRLYGNMFAGEVIFVLIAMLPWWGQVPLGLLWSGFHLLIIFVQAFIFMMLTVAYISMAQTSHD